MARQIVLGLPSSPSIGGIRIMICCSHKESMFKVVRSPHRLPREQRQVQLILVRRCWLGFDYDCVLAVCIKCLQGDPSSV